MLGKISAEFRLRDAAVAVFVDSFKNLRKLVLVYRFEEILEFFFLNKAVIVQVDEGKGFL